MRQTHKIGCHRLLHILESMAPSEAECEMRAAACRLINLLCNAHPAGSCEGLNACGEIDGMPIYVIGSAVHLSYVHSDPKATCGGSVGVPKAPPS